MKKPTVNRATEINKLHESFNKGLRTTIQKAIHIGELLVAQKKECGHGNWIPWIEANLKFSRATAKKYMACYANRERLNSNQPDDLTIEEFARSILPNGSAASHLPEPEPIFQDPKHQKIYQDNMAEYRAFIKEYAPERLEEVTDDLSLHRIKAEVELEIRWTKLHTKAETINHWLGDNMTERVTSGEITEEAAYSMAMDRQHDNKLKLARNKRYREEMDELHKLTYSVDQIFRSNCSLTLKLEKIIERGPHTLDIYGLKELIKSLQCVARDATEFARRLANPERKPKQADAVTLDGVLTIKQLPYHE